jgi:hypothetical protein
MSAQETCIVPDGGLDFVDEVEAVQGDVAGSVLLHPFAAAVGRFSNRTEASQPYKIYIFLHSSRK